MKKCPNCGAQVDDSSLFCTECGKQIPQSNVCSHCGASVSDGDAFCQNCGNRVDGSSVPNTNFQAQMPYATRSNSQNKSILPIIIGGVVLVMLILAGGAAWYFLNNQKNKYSLEGLAKVVENYDKIGDFHNGMAVVIKNEKIGYINSFGKEIIPCKYDIHDNSNYSEGFAVVCKDSYYGYIDKSGKEITKIVYSDATEFKNGFALVEKGGKWGFIDKTGKEIISPIFDYARNFSEGVAVVCKNEKWGFVDKTGKEVIHCEYEYANDFSEGLAPVQKNGKGGYINKKGEIVIPFQYGGYPNSFIDGYACVWQDGNFLIDITGKQVSEKYDVIEQCPNGISKVMRNAQSGLISNDGKEIFPCQYRIINSVLEDLFIIFDEENILVDKTGKTICKYEYDESGYTNKFSDGLLIVEKGGKYGFIDVTGKEVIPCIYDEAHSFSEGLAVVKKNGIYGYVDRNGKSTFGDQGTDINPEESIKNRINEIGQYALNNPEEKVVEKYFSSDFKRLYNRLTEYYDNGTMDGPWSSGDFWSGSSEDSPQIMTAGNVQEISDNRIIADMIVGTKDYKHAEAVTLILENGNWVIDDIRGHKAELKESIEYCESYEKERKENYDGISSASSQSKVSSSKTFANEQYVTMYLANQTFRSNDGFTIRFDGDLRMYAEGDYAGVVSVLRYNSTSALLRYGGGAYGEGKITVQIVSDRLQLTDPTDGSVYYQR